MTEHCSRKFYFLQPGTLKSGSTLIQNQSFISLIHLAHIKPYPLIHSYHDDVALYDSTFKGKND
jgi:hypothetical protein